MPPAASRAASRKAAGASAPAKTERFACDRCTKTYSRPDHLIRHKLNHDAKKILVCDHCSKQFVRQDLLARHIERHLARGGSKLGRWSNREGKDSGKGGPGKGDQEQSTSADGLAGQSEDVSDKEGEGTTSEEEEEDDGKKMQLDPRLAHSPVSGVSPGPTHTHYSRSPNIAPYGGGSSQLSPGELLRYPTPGGSATYRDSPGMGSPGLAPGMPPPAVSVGSPSAFGDHPYSSQQRFSSSVDPRDPIAADGNPASPMRSSFHVHAPPPHPYPGIQWGTSPRSASWPHSNGLAVPPTSAHAPGYYSAWPSNNRPPEMHNGEGPDVVTNPTLHTSTLLSSYTEASEANPFAPPPVDQSAEYRWLFDGLETISTSSQAHPSSIGATGPGTQDARFSPGSSDGIGRNGSVYSQSMNPSHSRSGEDASTSGGANGTQDGALGLVETDAYNALDSLAFFASLQAEIPNHPAFIIDDATHYRLIHFLSAVTELPTSPLFSPSALRCYVYLFFRSFNNLYPLIHEPTFDGRTADAMLLSSIIVIGAHYADNAAHELALRIARKLWGAYVSLDDFRPARATLPMLQAMLLTEAFGKLMSTRPLHETAHLFHTFLVTLARRNAVFTTSPVALPGPPGSEEQWRGWAREEEKKRIALFAFILDAQHATIFRHIPALSAFQIQLQLPVTEHEWTQPSAKAWHAFRSVKEYKPPPFLITTLKAHLVPSRAPPVLDTFSRFVVLHGLLSIAYDMRWKHDILLGAEGSGPSNDETLSSWRERLSTAFMAWKARLDASALSSLSDSSNTIFRASASMSTAAQIAVHADIVDFQIYAGLPSVLGRFIGKEAFCAARKAVKEWARTHDGRVATWHAVNFLRTSLQGTITAGPSNAPSPSGNGASNGASSPIGSSRFAGTKNVDHLLHHQWVQYLCALVVWGYGQAHASSKNNTAGAGPSLRGGNAAPSGGNGGGGHNSGTATPDSRFLPSPGLGMPGGPTSTLQQRNPAAAYYLDAMSTRSPEELVEVECISQTRGVLEVVERELRSSRWELGREAAGVLRKLIRTTEAPPLAFLHTASSSMTNNNVPGLNAAASTAHQLLANTFPHVKEEPPRAEHLLGSPLVQTTLPDSEQDGPATE